MSDKKKESSDKAKRPDYHEDHNVHNIHEPIMREKGDPEDGNEPMSLWVISLIGVTLFLGGLYMGMYGAGFDGEEYDERSGKVFTFGSEGAAASASKTAAAGGSADPIEKLMKRGKRIYSSNCASCHQSSGMGQAGIYPPLTNSDWVIGDAPKRLVAILLKGLEGPIHINGTKQSYSGVMQAWEKMLSDKDIAAVLTYIRANPDWGHTAGPIMPEDVAKIRAEMADRTKIWTEDELLKIPAGPLTTAAEPAAEEPAETAN